MDDESPIPMRSRAASISDLMMSLNTQGPSAAPNGVTVGECLLDTLCVKYLGTSGGRTIYEDSLYMNIIGEFALYEFLNENQIRSPVVRTEYLEVQEINMVSYRSKHTVTKVDKRWLPVTVRVYQVFRESKAPISSITQKHLSRIHGYGPRRLHPNGHRVYQVRSQDKQICGTTDLKGKTGMPNM